MTLRDFIANHARHELGNMDKVSQFMDWDVVREFQGFKLPDGFPVFWDNPVEVFCVVQYRNSKWKSIGLYTKSKKIKGEVVTQTCFAVKSDPYQSDWIIRQSLPLLSTRTPGDITLRGLHYKMVDKGMINSMTHYKRVVNAMIDCRRDGRVDYNMFADHDRGMECFTENESKSYDEQVSTAKRQIELWMKNYKLERWDEQEYYPEVWVEKKALIGAFKSTCEELDVAFAACKGYPSLTFLNQAAYRFRRARRLGHKPVLLYFGDYDPSGEDIPRSIEDNLLKDFGVSVEVRRVMLMEDQVVEWNLPPSPVKPGDSRSAEWDGLGQVELDAAEEKIEEMLRDAVAELFDEDVFEALKERELNEAVDFRVELREYVESMFDDE